MPLFRLTYRPGAVASSELVEAARVDVEGDAWLVFRSTVFVIGRPREVVVRRVAAGPVADVAEVLD